MKAPPDSDTRCPHDVLVFMGTDSLDYCYDCRQEHFGRVRLIVAEQWKIAITILMLARATEDHSDPKWWDSRAWSFLYNLADPMHELKRDVVEHEIVHGRLLPCAVDVLASLR